MVSPVAGRLGIDIDEAVIEESGSEYESASELSETVWIEVVEGEGLASSVGDGVPLLAASRSCETEFLSDASLAALELSEAPPEV